MCFLVSSPQPTQDHINRHTLATATITQFIIELIRVVRRYGIGKNATRDDGKNGSQDATISQANPPSA